MDKVFQLPELVASIIKCIDDDPSTMRAAALVARMWSSPAQTELFRAVKLWSPEDLASLQQVLANNQTLASCVRFASILWMESDFSPVFTFLSHTPALVKLELLDSGYVPMDIPPTGYALTCCSPSKLTINELCFNNFAEFVEFVRVFTPLNTLNIHALYLKDTWSKPSLPLPIQNLKLRTTWPPTAYLMAGALDREQLKTASFTCLDYQRLQTPFQFCSIAGSHIENLNIVLEMYSLEGKSPTSKFGH